MNLHLLLKNIHIVWGLHMRLITAKVCGFIIEFYSQFLLSFDSNLPISVSQPLAVQNHNPALHRDVCLVAIRWLVDLNRSAYGEKTWHMTQLTFSSNCYWKICFKFCILEQIIAIVLFICISSINNKRSLLRFQSTTASTNRGWSTCDATPSWCQKGEARKLNIWHK